MKIEGGIGSSFDEAPVPFLEQLISLPKNDDDDNDDNTLILMFVSTTGDGEQCDSIRRTWKSLLQKSLPKRALADTRCSFALFCLGDRAYGPQFCAAGRKLAVRLLQLGMPRFCEIGYGDDNTPNGGVFCDLDDWLESVLLPRVAESSSSLVSANDARDQSSVPAAPCVPACPYRVEILEERTAADENGSILDHGTYSTSDKDEMKEDAHVGERKLEFFDDSYRDYFTERGPITAYSYDLARGERIVSAATGTERSLKSAPLIGTVTTNERITDSNWKQDTRHIEIEVMHSNSRTGGIGDMPNGRTPPLPYIAGDVASVLPFNSRAKVNQFLGVLPDSIASMADSVIRIDLDESYRSDNRYTLWPGRCTLRGWLTYCADIQSLPEREDLRALSAYCAPANDVDGAIDKSLDQGEKLRTFGETSGAALYADYVLREKRSWIDVLHDFDSLRVPGSRLTPEALLMILPPMRTRDFSIASSPSMGRVVRNWTDNSSDRVAPRGADEDDPTKQFSIELCVAVVEGKTRLGRSYHGLCSKYLSEISPFRPASSTDRSLSSRRSSQLLVWIRPGSFSKMPLQLTQQTPSSFEVPIICVGAGTGIAPMRSLMLERVAVKYLDQKRRAGEMNSHESRPSDNDGPVASASSIRENENILIYGSRKSAADFYYEKEWETLRQEKNLRLLTAFSQDQFRKIYVQKVLREADDGVLIAKHILEQGGAVYIAGNPKMARAVKQEITEVLSDALPGGEEQTKRLLNKMQRMGRFSIEAWS